MSSSAARTPRRQQILEVLARELEVNPGTRITTALLAREVGVSEAALYRHFPSKAKMFEALIAFAEDSVFGLVGRILGEEANGARRCERTLSLLLTFSSRNPGITRVLLGDALVGESERLRARVAQFFNRYETQLKQVLREAEQRGEIIADVSPETIANLLMAIAEGRMAQYCRSGFARSPIESWDKQWRWLSKELFNPPQIAAVR